MKVFFFRTVHGFRYQKYQLFIRYEEIEQIWVFSPYFSEIPRAKRQLASGRRRTKESESLIKFIVKPETVKVGDIPVVGVAWLFMTPGDTESQ